MKIELTPEQIEIIKRSLRASAQRAECQSIAVPVTGSHGEAAAKAFYEKLEAECRMTLAVIEAETAEPEEDTCSECGADYGFCQCEEEEDDQ